MTKNVDLAAKIRDRLNARSGKELAKSFDASASLLQVESWIPLKKFFRDATGGEGFPCGHITQIIGKPDSGKTTLIMEGMVATQQAGGVAFLIDAEHKFSMQRFALIGGSPEDVVVIQVENLEEAWDAFCKILEDVQAMRDEGVTAPMMLAWDSLPASVPQKIHDGEAGDAHVSVEAKINNQNVRKLRQSIKKTQLAVAIINHYYMTMPKTPYEQSVMVIKGGEEITFLSTLIILTKQGAKITRTINKEEQQIGRVTRFLVHKGHFHGRVINKDVFVVDKGILETKEDLEAYKHSLRGEY